MKLFLTYKPVEYMRNKACYAGLMEIDADSGKLVRALKIPAAAFRTQSSFMAPSAQGLAIDGNIAYVGMWNYVAIVDLDDFVVVDSVSYPEMSDVHSIATDHDSIYVVCTASERLLCLNKSTLEKRWVWGGGPLYCRPVALVFFLVLEAGFICPHCGRPSF